MDKPKLTNSLINTYALSNSLNTISFSVPTLYLNMFITDFLGISPMAMAGGMLLARTVDFIVSLVAGIIIEKSDFKHGKYVSWIRILTATLFFGNIIQMLDTSAFVSSTTVRLVIVMIGYMMFHCSMNFYATSRAAMIPKLAGADMEDRKRITARQSQFGAAFSIISAAVTLPFVQFIEGATGSPSLGYLLVPLIFSAMFVVCNLTFAKMASPFDPPADANAPKRTPPTVGQMVSSLVTNKQMLVLFTGFTIFTIGSQIYAGVTTYYFRVTGTFSFYTIAQTSRSIVALLASMVGPTIGRKLGKKGSLILGWTIYSIGMLVMWAFGLNSDGSANLIVMTVAMCVNSCAMYLYAIFMANYYLDCGEYGYYTTGIDNRTMAVTVMNWPTKIGFALGGSLVGFVMSWAGYNPPVDNGLPSFTYMNRFMMSLGLIPAVCMILGTLVILLLYKLTDAQAAEYAKANADREAAAAKKAAAPN